MEYLLLLGAGIIAGSLNSLAGGGSFILYPALLLAGVPPVIANATNTFASLPGYVSGAIGFKKDIIKYKSKLPAYILAAIIGGYLGAEVLLLVSDAQFTKVVPWLMAVAVFFFAFGSKINAWISAHSSGERRGAKTGAIILLLLLTLVCFYGGFFNAGLGIILLAFFALAGFKDIYAMNGLKLLMSAIVSLIAVVRFTFADSIAWQAGSIAFIGTLIGGYVTAKLAHLIPTNILRAGIIIYGVIMVIVFFWSAYF